MNLIRISKWRHRCSAYKMLQNAFLQHVPITDFTFATKVTISMVKEIFNFFLHPLIIC